MEATAMDIVIIGGGPAGVAAGVIAASRGLQTMIVTRQISSAGRIGHIESVHPGIDSLLKKIGMEEAVQHSSRGTYSGIYSAGHFKSLNPYSDEVWMGNHLSRTKFDNYLINAAAEKDVIVRKERVVNLQLCGESQVITLASGEKISCRFVIDASGRSRFTGKNFFEEHYYSPPLTTWSGTTSNIDRSFFLHQETTFIPEESGWTWLAPLPPDQCTWTRLAITGSCELNPPSQLQNFSNVSSIKAANVTWRVCRPVAQRGLVLVGDAAGILDPAAGQGILNAVWSGIVAANMVADIFNNGLLEDKLLKEYDNWFIGSYLHRLNRLKEYYSEFDFYF